MAVTRAAAARAAELASRHPQAVQAFSEGVGSVLRQWTALELAVHNQWGGAQSSDRAADLVKEIVEMFTGPDKMYRDDVTLVLEDFMESIFFTICEDGSTDELGDMFVEMWRQCCAGDFTLVTNALAREYVRHEHEILQKSQGLSGGDADDGENDDIGDEGEQQYREACQTLETSSSGSGSSAAAAGVAGSMMTIDESIREEDGEEAPTNDEALAAKRVEPVIDEEGFETVLRGKKKKGLR